MAGKVKLPMGIENFKELRTMGYYYIDKTGLIRVLMENLGKVNLFTRPRRFGKTLNMSMLKCFFEAGGDSTVFDGLEISEERELCDKYMGKFPVISISLKSVEGSNFEEAKEMLRSLIGREALRQIVDRNYEEALILDGMKKVYRYGIACYKKRCKVVSG